MTRHLITSALPYINGVKHLGNLAGSMLPADIYSRYLRLRGAEVLYICATDEHGTPAELAAAEAGLAVEEYCNQQHVVQADVSERFGLSWDYFGRSSSSQNAELTQHVADRLTEADLIEERSTSQLYSIEDQRFLPDRYVIGTCPVCGYERARGDQCENCTSVLDPTDLIDPRSAISGSSDLEPRETKHLFLKLSSLETELRSWIDTKTDWPTLTTSIARKWLDEGVNDRAITRDLTWGVPVNRPGLEDKVFYVWFDAPIEYIGATREWADADSGSSRDWRSWWYEADDVEYTQFMAKDNVPFHTVFFPGMLMGTHEPWRLATYIKAFNWFTYYGGKFSTSEDRGIFMDDALEILPADYWRWYLTANAPESSDASFTWPGFAAVVNSDLADTFGNFVNRTLTFSTRTFGPEVPERGEWGDVEKALTADLTAGVARYQSELDRRDFRKAAASLRAIWATGNAYWEQSEPWHVVKSDRAAGATILNLGINLVRLYAVLSLPIIPQTGHVVLDALDADTDPAWPQDVEAELNAIKPGSEFAVPEVLFRKISDDDIEAWAARFGGPS